MRFDTLQYEVRDHVATVTLNRPERHNAFNQTMADELRSLWISLRIDDDVRCIVVTGAGEKAFCTGFDQTTQVPQPTSPYMIDDPGLALGPKSADLWKPVIAAVNGMACGGAFYILGESEFIIAADHATFFDPHVTYGMVAAFEPMLMSHYLPFPEIMRLSLMGNFERLSALRAQQLGMVSEVVPADQLAEHAHEIAATIARQPPGAIQGTLKALWTARRLGRHAALAVAGDLLTLGTTPETIAQGHALFQSGTRAQWRLR